MDDKVFFEAEYVLFIVFLIKDKSKIESLLQNEEIKKVFIEKQIDKLIWSYLRGIVMDAFNKHSLRPIPLPLVY